MSKDLEKHEDINLHIKKKTAASLIIVLLGAGFFWLINWISLTQDNVLIPYGQNTIFVGFICFLLIFCPIKMLT